MVLEQGALSGKYDTAHPMPAGSARANSYNPILDKLEIMNKALGKIADKYGVGIAQVPVAWAIANKDKKYIITVAAIGSINPKETVLSDSAEKQNKEG